MQGCGHTRGVDQGVGDVAGRDNGEEYEEFFMLQHAGIQGAPPGNTEYSTDNDIIIIHESFL